MYSAPPLPVGILRLEIAPAVQPPLPGRVRVSSTTSTPVWCVQLTISRRSPPIRASATVAFAEYRLVSVTSGYVGGVDEEYSSTPFCEYVTTPPSTPTRKTSPTA